LQKKRFPNLYKEELTAEKAKNSYKFDIENDGEWNQFNILKGNIKRKILILLKRHYYLKTHKIII